MIKYSFMSIYSNCTKEDAINLLQTTNKPIKYTYGLKYRNPTIYMVPRTRERALAIFEDGMCDVTEYEDYIDLNAYSSNDMW